MRWSILWRKPGTSRKLLPLIALSVFLLLLLPMVAQAAGGRRWTAAGVPVAGLPEFDELSPRSCSDGQSGAIIAWYSHGGTDNVYVQRLNAAGAEQWTPGGVKLTNNIAGGMGQPQVVTDDNHGAIVCWMDNGSGAMQVYGLHILAAGTIDPAWNGGAPVIAAGTGGLDIATFSMSRDGSGGALLAYEVTQAGFNQLVYAQRINSATGGQSYGVGRQVKSDVAGEDQEFPRIMPAGTTGAIVAFTGDGGGASPKAYLQRMDDNGFPLWNQPGGALTVSTRTNSYPGGMDYIDASNFVVAFGGSEDVGESVCLQKFDMLGAKQWDAAGIKLDNPGGMGAVIPKAFCDSGSTFVQWYHASDEAGAGVWAQKVNSSGTALWTAGGVLVSGTINNSFTTPSAWPSFTTDGLGGAICSWTDVRTGTANTFVQRLNSSGAGQWGTTGMAACTQNSPQSNACLVSDDAFGGIVTWEDQRSTPGLYDLFAQRVANAAPTFTSVSPNSSFTNNNVTLAITGANFMPGVSARVRPHGTGTMTTAATNTYVSATRLNSVFNFAGLTAGSYDVGIYNNDGQSVWASNKLTLGTAPNITSVSSTSTYPGGPAITVNGTNFTTAGTLSFNGVPATSITSWSNTKIVAQAPEGSSSGPLTVTTDWGTSNAIQMTLTTPEQNLAEGSNAWGFQSETTLVNISPQIQEVLYEIDVSGNELSSPPTWTLELQPLSTLDVSAETLSVIPDNAGDLVNLENLDFSSRVISVIGDAGPPAKGGAVDSKSSMFADRTMEWRGKDAESDEITASIGATTTANDWYMPEGSSNWGFETWTLVQNPGNKKANLTFTYMVEGQGPKIIKHTVAAKSRATFSMEQDIGKKDASIQVSSEEGIICERSMYRDDKREGHDSVGATRPAEDYYLAEGTTAWGFTSYVLIQNPNKKDVDVTLTFMTENGPKTMKTFKMPAGTRKTVRVNDVTPAKGEKIDMSNCDFSVKVHGSLPIIAERAMYWGKDTPKGEATHDSIGTPMPHKTWVLGDGEDSDAKGKTETYTLVQNPNDKPVDIEIVYMTPGDAKGGKQPNKTVKATIKANSRKTFNMGDYIKGRAATKVTCTTKNMKIIVERAMYINQRGGGSDTIGAFND
jgi:hypothetical protein